MGDKVFSYRNFVLYLNFDFFLKYESLFEVEKFSNFSTEV